VADVFILGIFGTLVFLAVGISQHGVAPWRIAKSVLWLVLLSYGILRIYRAKAPWRDGVTRTLIWLVFVLAFILNVIVPPFFLSVLDVPLVIPSAIVYGIVFIYVLWVLRVSKRAMAPEA
jgi:hypothetical protein